MMNNEFWQQVFDFFENNRGKVLGALFGFLLGILILVIGFWKTIIIFVFTILGYLIGSRWDSNDEWRKFLDRILPPQIK